MPRSVWLCVQGVAAKQSEGGDKTATNREVQYVNVVETPYRAYILVCRL